MTKRRRRKVRLHKLPMPTAGHQLRPRGALRHPERTTLRTNITIIRRRPRFIPRPTYCLWAPKFECERKRRSIQPQRPKGRPMRLKSPTMFSTPTATWSFPVVQTLRSSFDRLRREPAFMAPPTLCWICNRFRLGASNTWLAQPICNRRESKGLVRTRGPRNLRAAELRSAPLSARLQAAGKERRSETVLTFQLDKPVQIVEAK